MRKMIFLTNISERHLVQIREMAPGWEVIKSKDDPDYAMKLSQAEIIAGWNKKAEAEALKENSQLRWVHSWGAGVNTMPLEGFKRKNIILTNASGVHAFPISENIFAMMLSFTRKIHRYIRKQPEGHWLFEGNLGEVHGKTLGILGVGSIGEEVAKLAKAFNMKVLGLRRSGKALLNVDHMYDMAGLEEILRNSDYIVNILPSTKETRKLIGFEQFNKMKATAFYMSVGRGDTTDTAGLVAALEKKLIAGAGLDVFEREPLPKESPLWYFENVIITPHNSGATDCYEDRVIDIFTANFKDYSEGKMPSLNLVNLDLEY